MSGDPPGTNKPASTNPFGKSLDNQEDFGMLDNLGITKMGVTTRTKKNNLPLLKQLR